MHLKNDKKIAIHLVDREVHLLLRSLAPLLITKASANTDLYAEMVSTVPGANLDVLPGGVLGQTVASSPNPSSMRPKVADCCVVTAKFGYDKGCWMRLGWGEGRRKDWAWRQVPHYSDLVFLGQHPLKTSDNRVPASSLSVFLIIPVFFTQGRYMDWGNDKRIKQGN